VTVCAHDLEIRVDLYARDGGGERAEALGSALASRFPDDLFAEDDRPVAEIVLELCRERSWTLATAESCTGGLVGARLTDVAGASDVYLGGAVAYANAAKEALIGVPRALLDEHGAVSAEVADAMADGARSELGADVAVAVTGVAGPEGGTEEKPVGLVFLSVRTPAGGTTERFVLPGDREAVRARATAWALHTLRRLLAQPGTLAHERSG
jgi:nicotinamide-nucleotide amidase